MRGGLIIISILPSQKETKFPFSTKKGVKRGCWLKCIFDLQYSFCFCGVFLKHTTKKRRDVVVGLNFDSITIHLLTGAIAVVYSPKVESICNLLSVMILLAAWCKYPLVWKVTRGPVWARWYSLLGVSIVIGTTKKPRLTKSLISSPA